MEQRLKVQSRELENGCWQWQATVNNFGYGIIRPIGGGPRTPAHRVSYETFRGPIPVGLDIDHLCRNPGCINPEHLEPVTHQENIRRGWAAKKTHCKQGHPLSGSNLIASRSHRSCRLCNNARQRAYRQSQSATRKAS
jgi:hypothetical protein